MSQDAWCRDALSHPALDAVRPYAERLASFTEWPSVPAMDVLLRDRLSIDPAVSLEPQARKPRRRRAALDREALYVVRIARHGRVPTRERSWHDLTNALVWAAFPRSKRALAARQLAILDARVPRDAMQLPNARSREEDALAMLDEGGVVIAATDGDAASLAAAQRAGDRDALRARGVPHVFGHALMEHAIAGRTDVRGYAVVLAARDPRCTDDVDAALAAWIAHTDALLAPAPWRAIALDEVVRCARDGRDLPAPGERR
jgi:hypothetical protein